MILATVLPAAAAVVIADLLTGRLSRPGAPFSVLDLPNERSLHVRPTPRTGGLAIAAAVVLGWLGVALWLGVPVWFGWIAAAAAAIALVSFADDRGGVRARYRFAVHLTGGVAALVAGLGLGRLPLPVEVSIGPVLGAGLTIAFVVWMTNLYNFMDGMDGFAGGMSVAGFGALAHAFWAHGDDAMAAVSLVVAAGALGFLRHNFPPASIFLGDVGSAPLGFSAAALMLEADRTAAMPLWGSILVFSPFIVDATVTILRRLARGERIWEAHRTHYYQRLVQAGWGHRRTVLHEYALMLACAATAVVARDAAPAEQWLVLGAWTIAYALLARAVAGVEASR